MIYIRITCAGALVSTLLLATVSPKAIALEGWSDGSTPVFRSDIFREQQRLERDGDVLRSRYRMNFPPYMEGGPQPVIAPEAPPVVSLPRSEPPGLIIVDTGGKRLFFTLPGNRAYEYPISVGRDGFTWTGTERISRIAAWPSWHPPAEMRQREPGLPIVMTGGINNPLGATALYLGNTLYRIHGTNDPRTIGQAASSGCFRMMNSHVIHLAGLAGIGTQVRVVSSY